MLLICLCWIRIIGVSRLHSTRQTLESNIALEQTGQKKGSFFIYFFTILFFNSGRLEILSDSG